jgi:MoaA/NifB/PqqE/SkfB family radical SAM enzyme
MVAEKIINAAHHQYHRMQRFTEIAQSRGINKAFKWAEVGVKYYIPSTRKILKNYDLIPIAVEIETTTICGMNCKMCEQKFFKPEYKQLMPLDKFKHLIDAFPRLSHAGLTGIGEIQTHPNCLDMFRYVKQKHDPFIEIFDNFNFMTKERVNTILTEKLTDHIFVSLDAATEGTYKIIRPNGNFNKVVENITYLLKRRKELNDKLPWIDFHFVYCKDNYQEIPDYIDLVAKIYQDAGLDSKGAVVLVSPILYEYAEIKGMRVVLPEPIAEEAKKRAEKHGILLKLSKTIAKTETVSECVGEWQMPFIFVDGTVITCCAGNEANKRPYQIQHSMGNIFEVDTFEQLWRGEKYERFKKQLEDGEIPPCCAYCATKKNCKGDA